jgi:NADH-quinone oxidoreductase subunit C
MSSTERLLQLSEHLRAALGDSILSLVEHAGQLTAVIIAEHWVEAARRLRSDPDLHFEQLIDLCGVDYSSFGADEWATESASRSGFSRARRAMAPAAPKVESRFAVVAQLLSVRHNQRLRIRTFAAGEPPTLPTLTGIWASADWYEREAFDLYGILFDGHADLRRILTDYGFIGHPFRKDFPLEGHVEVRYDPDKGRVVYQPVSIENRVLVPRVIREDHRWLVDQPEPGRG